MGHRDELRYLAIDVLHQSGPSNLLDRHWINDMRGLVSFNRSGRRAPLLDIRVAEMPDWFHCTAVTQSLEPRGILRVWGRCLLPLAAPYALAPQTGEELDRLQTTPRHIIEHNFPYCEYVCFHPYWLTIHLHWTWTILTTICHWMERQQVPPFKTYHRL